MPDKGLLLAVSRQDLQLVLVRLIIDQPPIRSRPAPQSDPRDRAEWETGG
jgi:hypothetical protein